MKKGDFIIIAFVIVLALGFSFYSKLFKNKDYDKTIVKVSIEESVYNTYELDLNTEESLNIKSSLGYNQMEINNGEVWISESDCHNQICVLDGKINEPGDILVCLPHKLVIEIEGVKNLELDGISH